MQGGNYYEQKKSLINLTFWPLVIDPSIIGLESKLCLASLSSSVVFDSRTNNILPFHRKILKTNMIENS